MMTTEISKDAKPADHQQALVLRPCPFCGGHVRFDDIDAHSRGVGYRIECEPCYLSMWAFKFEKPESVANRWNQSQLTDVPKRIHEAIAAAGKNECGKSGCGKPGVIEGYIGFLKCWSCREHAVELEGVLGGPVELD